jgi:BirA family biotin operon repressor/biotin-[acetyl-CoA-carboxylase] ligase
MRAIDDQGWPAFFQVITLDATDSTNEEIRRRADEGASEGTLVVAKTQSAGRGRRGRTWLSPVGNLYFSFLLRPVFPPAEAMQLAFVVALSLAETVRLRLPPETRVSCKWPNDILLSGRKVAGILLESQAGPDGRLQSLTIGVGLNIASHPPDREVMYPATSLRAEGARDLDPGTALKDFCWRFDDWYGQWRQLGFTPVRNAWLAMAHGLGQEVEVRLDQGQVVQGIFVDMNLEGYLILETERGRRKLAAGDVFPAIRAATA